MARSRSARNAESNVLPIRSDQLSPLCDTLGGKKIAVLSNREPYSHNRIEGGIEVKRPASGLVTALEPILRNCGGFWIAHGSGNADFEVCDGRNEVAVPPENPNYTLKRVWLSEEEEQGYYYGFSNEGLWPLCHMAYNKPAFRLSDWQNYSRVNQRFCANTPEFLFREQAILLVQDYHFALLPRMLKERATRMLTEKDSTRVGLFWHIPWPSSETFSICPWASELLDGMLGADVIGFHTQQHCNNFLESCEKHLEARVDWDTFSVTMRGHETLVQPFPIGIDTAPIQVLPDSEIRIQKERFGIHADIVAVGVDRIDYTKGLLERVEAVERFLEKNPRYVGKFSYAQIGSPSRTHIPAYQSLTKSLHEAVERINQRFSNGSAWKPIVLIDQHHDWQDLQLFYQLGDICLVTSLHDGMNLVAKEYVWCQKPERGALILSRFTGASHELNEAFVVNPYSIEETADAIAQAIQLSSDERRRRMEIMRQKVEHHNAFHWASSMINSLIATSSRQPLPEHPRKTA